MEKATQKKSPLDQLKERQKCHAHPPTAAACVKRLLENTVLCPKKRCQNMDRRGADGYPSETPRALRRRRLDIYQHSEVIHATYVALVGFYCDHLVAYQRLVLDERHGKSHRKNAPKASQKQRASQPVR